MADYDRRLSWAKEAVTQMLANLASDNTKFTLMDLAARIDDLNKAWDELTDALVNQRTARDETISELHRKLAEERKRFK